MTLSFVSRTVRAQRRFLARTKNYPECIAFVLEEVFSESPSISLEENKVDLAIGDRWFRYSDLSRFCPPLLHIET